MHFLTSFFNQLGNRVQLVVLKRQCSTVFHPLPVQVSWSSQSGPSGWKPSLLLVRSSNAGQSRHDADHCKDTVEAVGMFHEPVIVLPAALLWVQLEIESGVASAPVCRQILLEVQLVQLLFHKGQVCTCEQVEV